jgi:hypothetical protein
MKTKAKKVIEHVGREAAYRQGLADAGVMVIEGLMAIVVRRSELAKDGRQDGAPVKAIRISDLQDCAEALLRPIRLFAAGEPAPPTRPGSEQRVSAICRESRLEAYADAVSALDELLRIFADDAQKVAKRVAPGTQVVRVSHIARCLAAAANIPKEVSKIIARKEAAKAGTSQRVNRTTPRAKGSHA